jgi:hypothetical protein
MITSSATAGSFTLSYRGQTTGPLAYSASASDIQAALNGLSTISGDGSVTVTGSVADGWTVTFNTIGEKFDITASVGMGSVLTTTQTDGNATTKESQVISNPGKNDLVFTFGAYSSNPVMVGSTADYLQTTLNNLDSIAAVGGVTVSGSGDAWTISFNKVGNQPAITATIYTFTGQQNSDETTAGNSTTAEVHTIKNDDFNDQVIFAFGSDKTAPLSSAATAEIVADALNAL